MSAATDHHDFMALVETLPPRPIRNKRQLAAVYREIDRLMRLPKRSTDERDYLELLSILVEEYEATLVPTPEVSQGQMLDHLLDARKLTQAQVAKATGISANLLSNVRAGRRELSKDNIRKLSEFLKISPGVWL